MLIPVARVGDKSNHNGEIITGSPTWMDDGWPVRVLAHAPLVIHVYYDGIGRFLTNFKEV